MHDDDDDDDKARSHPVSHKHTLLKTLHQQGTRL